MPHFDSMDELPPKLRALVEKQLAKQNNPPKQTIEPQEEKTPITKYHNVPTETMLPNGAIIKHKSKKEKAYFQNLLAMQRAGIVRNIRLEVQILITPSYTDADTGEHFKSQSYICDFVYEQLVDDKWVKKHVDTKGKKTREYINKRKILNDRGIFIEEA